MSTHTLKQAKASEAEVDALIAWFNKREGSAAANPPWRRVVFGYQVLVDNACDPTKDYLAWKPGLIENFKAPQEAAANQREAVTAQELIDYMADTKARCVSWSMTVGEMKACLEGIIRERAKAKGAQQ